MSRPTLPTRRRYRIYDRHPITDEFRRAAAEFGARTTQKGAARKFGVSFTSIKNWMVALGLPSRPMGSPTSEDIGSWGTDYPGPDVDFGPAPLMSQRPA